jgi:hypothetical protein
MQNKAILSSTYNMYHSLRTEFLNIVCGRSMISFDKLHSADRSTSMIRKTITNKTEITG